MRRNSLPQRFLIQFPQAQILSNKFMIRMNPQWSHLDLATMNRILPKILKLKISSMEEREISLTFHHSSICKIRHPKDANSATSKSYMMTGSWRKMIPVEQSHYGGRLVIRCITSLAHYPWQSWIIDRHPIIFTRWWRLAARTTFSNR